MKLHERLKIAQAAGPEYSELSSVFEAAIDLLRTKRDRDALCNLDFATWISENGQAFLTPAEGVVGHA
jgi:hypothetical protein